MGKHSTLVEHFFSFKKRRININYDIVINTCFGFIVALIFKDFKDIFVDHLITRIITNNLKTDRKKVKFLNTELDINLFIEFLVHIIFVMLFIFIFVYKRV